MHLLSKTQIQVWPPFEATTDCIVLATQFEYCHVSSSLKLKPYRATHGKIISCETFDGTQVKPGIR